MGNIEAGEYIRTKSGIIIRVDIIDFERLRISQKGRSYEFEDMEDMEDFIKNEIVKHSKNIIDLIEKGDFVNGHKVTAVYLDGATKYIKLDNAYSIENNFSGIRTYNKDIKSILTKEQYDQNCYRLEAKDE